MRAAVDEICADAPAGAVEILPGKLVVEIKAAGINKANAVCELMNCAPFADRNPIFIGDDTTDEPVFGVIAQVRRLGLFGRPDRRRRQRAFRETRIGARLARAHRESGPRHGVMTVHGLDLAVIGKIRTAAAQRDPRPEHGGMIDHGLDLAVIGNGRTAALVDPCSRIVWWCYPRFDGDPIFCRLVAGQEEKGFSDVVLEDMADFQSEYVRNTAIVSTDTDRPQRRQSADHRFRAALSPIRPRVSAAAALSHHRTDRRPAAHHHPDAADLRLRQAAAAPLARQQPHPLFQRLDRDPPDHGRAAVADRRRGALRADAAAASGVRSGRAVHRRSAEDLPRFRRTHA